MIHRRTGMQIVSMRLGNVIAPDMYVNFPAFIHNSFKRKHLLWSYIDARDAATACRLAIEADNLGYVEINVASNETSMDIESAELIAREYPEVKDIRENIEGFQTLLSNKKAKALLNWNPINSWRDFVEM